MENHRYPYCVTGLEHVDPARSYASRRTTRHLRHSHHLHDAAASVADRRENRSAAFRSSMAPSAPGHWLIDRKNPPGSLADGESCGCRAVAHRGARYAQRERVGRLRAASFCDRLHPLPVLAGQHRVEPLVMTRKAGCVAVTMTIHEPIATTGIPREQARACRRSREVIRRGVTAAGRSPSARVSYNHRLPRAAVLFHACNRHYRGRRRRPPAWRCRAKAAARHRWPIDSRAQRCGICQPRSRRRRDRRAAGCARCGPTGVAGGVTRHRSRRGGRLTQAGLGGQCFRSCRSRIGCDPRARRYKAVRSGT